VPGLKGNTMNKEQLIALIMANTDEYKKSHLACKKIAEVREIAEPYLPKVETTEDDINNVADSEPETPDVVIVTEDNEDKVSEIQADTSEAGEAKKEKGVELNTTQKILLETLPQLADFKNAESIVTGKALLDKVMELHGISPKKSGPVIVSLKRKEYIKLVGKKSGQKHITVQLLPRGIEYLGFSV